MTQYSIVKDSNGATVSVFYADGNTVTIPESHPKFKEIIALLVSGDSTEETVKGLVNVLAETGNRLSRLSERVTVSATNVFFDGDPLRIELADLILELAGARNDEKLKPLLNFLEKASTNPSQRSIDELYNWIAKGDLTITEDGYFIGYKGITRNGAGEPVSIHSGRAFVDDVEHTGQIPNPVGAVITMPRSEVGDNQNLSCSTGLHIGTHSFAKGFARNGDTILVKIHPRDVVSVPNHDASKIRVCRYEVIGKAESRLDERLYVEVVKPVPEEPDVIASKYETGWSRKLLADEAEKAASTPSKAIRNAKGQFTKESAKGAIRNAKGQFVKQN